MFSFHSQQGINQTILRSHLTPVRITINKTTANVGEDAGPVNPSSLLVEVSTGTAPLQISMEVVHVTKHGTKFDPILPVQT